MLICLKCRWTGHRQLECPRGEKRDGGPTKSSYDKGSQIVTHRSAVASGEKTDTKRLHRALMGCLIGEPIRGDDHRMLMLEEVQMGLWDTWQSCGVLRLGCFSSTGHHGCLYRGQLAGHEFNGEMGVKWRCILPTDESSLRECDALIVEARGVPLGYRSKAVLEALVTPFASILWVILDGLVDRDPRIVLSEAEGPTGTTHDTNDREPCLVETNGWEPWCLAVDMVAAVPASSLTNLGAADDGQDKGAMVGVEETSIDEEPSTHSGGQQNLKTLQTDMGIKEVQQPLEKINGRTSASTQDTHKMSDQTSLGRNGAEGSSKLGNRHLRHTKMGDMYQEGLVYRRKKVGLKHEKGSWHG